MEDDLLSIQNWNYFKLLNLNRACFVKFLGTLQLSTQDFQRKWRGGTKSKKSLSEPAQLNLSLAQLSTSMLLFTVDIDWKQDIYFKCCNIESKSFSISIKTALKRHSLFRANVVLVFWSIVDLREELLFC